MLLRRRQTQSVVVLSQDNGGLSRWGLVPPRRPALPGSISVPKPFRVIRTVYGLWDSTPIPKNMARLNAWKARHPSWTLVIHSRSEAETLLEKEFPWLGPLYKGLPKIQQADLLRLLFVYVYGGLYIDIDVRCSRPMEETLTRAGFDPSSDSLVAFVEGSAVFSSDAVTLASAHHPLRNGIPEIRTRIANYIFFCPQQRSEALFAIILHVASRLARWQALSPGQKKLVEKRPWDPEYITLFLTGPDAFTEAVFGGPNVSPLGGVLVVNEHLSRAYTNVGSGSWRNSTYACRMWGVACM